MRPVEATIVPRVEGTRRVETKHATTRHDVTFMAFSDADFSA
jgi:hypothetical protein